MADLAAAGTRPDERGTLDVRVLAIQHVVERAVLDTPGAVAHRTAFGRLRGSDSPRAEVTMQGRSALVAVDVACVWPCRVTEVATQVRDSVRTETARLTGVHVQTVDVTVHVLAADDATVERRRVE